MGIIRRSLIRIPAFYNCFGWKGVALIFRLKYTGAKLVRFNYPKRFRHPLYLRKGSSDFPIFESVMVQRCYDINYNINGKCSPEIIFDCGANIGLATIFYANRFPNAKIIAVEPEPANFELLKKNTAPYPNIRLYQAGLWNKPASLKIEDQGYGAWGFMVSEAPEGSPGAIKAVSIPELMRQQVFEKIDILKIDIEGSEKELFESGYDAWLPKVKTLIIELHDRMREGAALSFFKALTKYNFRLAVKGENLICFMK
ncbi:MAG: FkbM family methyltransferase [Prevotellaceae bacterium]|jgi:FkbM family methyltransferase|nr:FkbM family methyltransferase [Prevotellaceae bacterium]